MGRQEAHTRLKPSEDTMNVAVVSDDLETMSPHFGNEYAVYLQRTKRLIPFLY